MPTAERSRAEPGRSLQDDEAGSLKMLDQTLRNDPRHQFGRVVLPFAALEPERERQRVGEIIGRCGCQALCHGRTVAAM